MGQYREPSVEITQVQETVTVNAGISDLMAGIIGPAYNVVGLDSYIYPWYTTASGSPLGIDVPISGIAIGDTALTMDPNSIFVEMVSKTNELIPFTGDITYNAGTQSILLEGPGNTSIVTILPNMDPATPASLKGYRPKIAYRAQFTDRNKEMFVKTTEDITTSVGNTTWENPLGFAAGLMLQNNPDEFMVYPIKTNDSAGYLESQNSLDNSSVYAFAILDQRMNEVLNSFITWTNARSAPEHGNPTKLYISPLVTWYNDAGVALSGNQLGVIAPGYTQKKFSFVVDQLPRTYKNYTAKNIAAANAQLLNRRVSSIYPDMAWYMKEIHVLQTRPGTDEYLETVTGMIGAQCVLVDTLTLLDGEILHAGTIVDTATYAKLVDTTKYNKTTVKVYIPIRGVYLAVQQAALVSALLPSDPKTQYPVGGIHKIAYSEQYFGKEYTNTIAGGGTNVIIQPSLSVLPASRHHLTTDMSSTQAREDNIVHQVDIVTINYIIALRTLVGRYKQTPKFFKLLRATLSAYAEVFKLKEYVKEIQILEVKQHSTELDKVVVILRLLPYYAVNYIDVTILY